MKYVKYVYLILLPLLIYAQATDKAEALKKADISIENCDWCIVDQQGIVLAISGDSINFEEKWLHPVPAGLILTAKSDAQITIQSLEPPFLARVSLFGKGKRTYLSELHFLKQFKHSRDGMIVE